MPRVAGFLEILNDLATWRSEKRLLTCYDSILSKGGGWGLSIRKTGNLF